MAEKLTTLSKSKDEVCDDDGDGVLTIHEDYNQNSSPLDDDTNSNSIPDYLDNAVFLNTESFILEKEVKLFPNPVENHLTISTSNNDYQSVEILDANGKLISIVNENMSNIDFSKFEVGTYFIKINWIDKSMDFKVIKI